MGKLLKGPLMITIPLLALIMVAGIGIGFGLLFVLVTNEFNEDLALIAAVALTAIIMAVAGLLSYADHKNPQGSTVLVSRPAGRSGGESQASAHTPVTERPERGQSRSDGRRKSR